MKIKDKLMRLLIHLFPLSILFFYSAIAMADTCPPAINVQHNTTPGWHAYDSDTDQRLSAERTLTFQANAKIFALAEWMNSGKTKGEIHCYYRDNDGSNLEAYLAKDKYVSLSNTN